jgi:FdhE protein
MGPSMLATAAEPWTERRRRLAELRKRQPFARQLLDLYGALLPVQETAFFDAVAASPPPHAVAAFTAEVVVPRVLDVSIAAGPDQLRGALMNNAGADHRQVIDRWMRGDEQPLAERYLARAALGPVLEALGPEARAACTGPRDARHCPECGGPPQLSYVAPAGEDLATGPRYLVCARCHAAWGYARMTCAGCGEDSGAKLPIYSEDGTTSGERGSVVRGLPGPATNGGRTALFPHMRIEACETCRHYLLNVDLLSDRHAVPLVDELAAIPLDLYARDRGFSKIILNLMGF